MTQADKIRANANGPSPLPWWPAWSSRWASDSMSKLSATQQATFFHCVCAATSAPQPEGRPSGTRLVLDTAGEPLPPVALAKRMSGTPARHIYKAIGDLVALGYLSVRPADDLAGTCDGPGDYLGCTWTVPDGSPILCVESFDRVLTGTSTERSKKSRQSRVQHKSQSQSQSQSQTSSSDVATDQPRPPEHNSSSLLKSDDPPEQAAAGPEATAPPDNPAAAFEGEGTEVDRLVSALRCAQQRQGVDDSRWHGTHHKHAEAFLRSHSCHEGMLAVALRESEYRHPQRRQGECYLNALGAWRHYDTAKDRLVEQYGDGRWHDEGRGRIRWYGPTGDPWYVRPSADDVTSYAIEVDDSQWPLETMAAGKIRMRQPDDTVVYLSERRVWDLIIEGRIPCEGVPLGEPQWRDGYGWGGALIDGATLPNPDHHYWKIEVAREDKCLPGWVRDAFIEAGKIDTRDERVPLPGPRLEQHNEWSAALDDHFKAQMKGDSDEIERTKARLAECSNP